MNEEEKFPWGEPAALQEKPKERSCFEEPVWALYGDEDGAEIIHACLPAYNDKRNLPTKMLYEGGHWTSRSQWAWTREELIEKAQIKPSCSRCGSPYSTHYCNEKELVERNLCFGCNHWLHSTMPRRGQPGFNIINGTVYSFDAKQPLVVIRGGGAGYGHGGREFTIQILATGETVRTNNLWCGGRVPKRFMADFPDTARFVETPKPIGHGQGYLG